MSSRTAAWALASWWCCSRNSYAAARRRARRLADSASCTTRSANAAGSDSMNASRPDSISSPHAPSVVVTTGIPWRNASSSLMLMPNAPNSGATIAAELRYTDEMS